jgi:hypothetical protein
MFSPSEPPENTKRKRKSVSKDHPKRPPSHHSHLVKGHIERSTLNALIGEGLIVDEILTLGIAADDAVDGKSNAKLSLATDPASVLVLGLLLDLCIQTP